MMKKFLAIALVFVMSFCFSACSPKDGLPKYAENEFEISAFWAPYDISEEGLQQYKAAGFNTLAMINHSLGNTSEEQFYLGSKRTMTALENCKKVGLKAILNYNDWMAERCEGEGYNGETPFSTYDLYDEYNDIISGIHICDEPRNYHIPIYGNETLIEDFKKTYPDKDYIVNLVPLTVGNAITTIWEYEDYEHMMSTYETRVMEYFEKPYISLDFYPFHTDVPNNDMNWLKNYLYIANSAKKYNAEKTFILQASTGNEFEDNLTERDMRLQVYTALAYGADNLQYYCYSVPKTLQEDGTYDYMYNYCIMKQDDTPSDLYYYLQDIHKEIQSFAKVILAYDWQESIGVYGSVDATFRMTEVGGKQFEQSKNYVSAESTMDLHISRFTSDEFGEAYMFLNFTGTDGNICDAEITFKDCSAVAVYGGEDFDGEPQIIELDENKKFNIQMQYGSGKFVVPLA